MPPRIPDENDFETSPGSSEMADAEVTYDLEELGVPVGRPPGEAMGHLKLRFPATCRVCKRRMLIGDDAFGPRLGGQWDVQHPFHYAGR